MGASRLFARWPWQLLVGVSLVSCAGSHTSKPKTNPDALATESSLDRRLAELPVAHLTPSDAAKAIDAKLASHFQAHASKRGYLMTDKPLYQPGETIWLRADLRATGTLIGPAGTLGATLQLVSPRGAIVASRRIAVTDGVGLADVALDAAIEGGEYTVQLAADDGTTDARKLVINTYEAPRLKKSLEFVKQAYGAGDTAQAAIAIARTTGEPFADRALTAVVTVDDVEVARQPIKTDKDGKAIAKFQLPATIARGDGLLTILADDGGVVESIQRRIPIVVKNLALELYPEGGDLVDGLPGRVYFAAKTPLGKPADIEGKVVDDLGTTVAELASIHDGLGRLELTPSADRTYHVVITKPAGVTQRFELPGAKTGGCVVRALSPKDPGALRVAATCSTARTVLVEATLREQRVAGGAVEVAANTPTLVELPIDPAAQGAVRVTLLSSKEAPLAERLVYHGRGHDMHVRITADRKAYSPRDPVKLHVQATDDRGRPVKASLGVAVVDDTVLAFADDKGARVRAHLFLEPELGVNPNDPSTAIENPNYYFGDAPEAPAAMDALLATRGYRRFEWQQVFAPPPPPPPVAYAAMPVDELEGMPAAMDRAEPQRAPARGGRPRANAKAPPRPMPAAAPPPPPAPKQGVAVGKKHAAERPIAAKVAAAEAPMIDRRGPGGGGRAAGRAIARDIDADDFGDMPVEPAWAPVRVFPVPAYTKGYVGPRTDFRETIFWNGNVQTDGDGKAEVAFVASDAITSFRATAEGVSAGGLPGGGEATFAARMPVSLDAHLPVEVTQGDAIRLPVSITNETDDTIDAELGAQFGAAFRLGAGAPDAHAHVRLAAHEKRALFYPLDVIATSGTANAAITLDTGGLHDAIDKPIRVVPLGFPFEGSVAGTAKPNETVTHHVKLAGALPGSIAASVTMYPSPLASMTQGMAAMIREPGGCFEQTSSSNYPNIMVLSYLESNDGADAALVTKTAGTLDRGYKLLTGYETTQKGYEWFGHTPGHEALTAYGLMEFADMAKVYDVDHAMVERTADWLMSRRDGKGGFQRSSEALDSFGRASEATTNAYIMWALAEAKRTRGLDKELGAAIAQGEGSKDPYVIALATNTALLAKAPAAPALVKKLVELQDKSGSFPGAKESITMSGGESLAIEATSLAVLALIKASPNNEYEPAIRSAVDYLNQHRSGYGQWANTQATILGLKALTAYSEHARQMSAGGAATLVINGKRIGTIAFEKGRKDALVWDGDAVAHALIAGDNTIALELEGGAPLPYSIALDYRSAHPASSPNAKIAVTTALDKASVKLGEGVKLRAHVENTTTAGQPMTLARIGIPGGTVFQTWQLKELRDKGLVDFYETRPREVILYWRALAPGAKKDVALDLLAAVPGTYESPASSAYLYYTAEDKAWTAPTKITIEK